MLHDTHHGIPCATPTFLASHDISRFLVLLIDNWEWSVAVALNLACANNWLIFRTTLRLISCVVFRVSSTEHQRGSVLNALKLCITGWLAD